MLSGKYWLRLLLLVWCLGSGCAVLSAADNSEARNLYQTGSMLYQDGAYDQAERSFSRFLTQFPNSPRLAEVALLEARALYELKRFDDSLGVIETYQPKAGAAADQFQHLKARNQWGKKEYEAAAKDWRELTERFPKSAWLPEAAYSEALAFTEAKNWTAAVQVLTDEKRVFVALSKVRPGDEYVIKGTLLLGETLLALKDYGNAEQTLVLLAEKTLTPQQAWKRLQLLVLVLQGQGKLAEATQNAVTLVAQARTLGQNGLLEESVALRASALQAEKRYDDAIEAWRTNLAVGVSPERQRQALFAIIELNTTKGNTEQSIQLLADFAAKNPTDSAIIIVRLTLGELRLKEYYRLKAASLADTNLLQITKQQFEQVLTNQTDSSLVGRASLGHGWCAWELGQMEAAQVDFKRAAELLPQGTDQAIARFKWADTQFALNDLESAVVNYLALVEQYGGVVKVREGLLDKALYQLVRAAIRLNKQELATAQLVQLLAWFPESYYSENSLLLVGQSHGRIGRTAEAKNLLEQFVLKFPNSDKMAEIQLAQARLNAVERDWNGAISIYTNWLNQYTNDTARPRAMFDLGWLQFKAGQESLALLSYTNFVNEFPTNILVPQAHYWMAEHFEREKDYSLAEKHYQLIFQNTNVPPNELSYRARLMAGRAAFSRQAYGEAQDYFTWLIENGPPWVTNSTISTQLVAQAYFASGDTYLSEPMTTDPLRMFDRFGFAIGAYEIIPKKFTNSVVVPMAYYKLGNCYFQYAALDQDTNRYAQARLNYEQAIASPLATVETRSLAEIGLAKICEKLARLRGNAELKPKLYDEALEHYRNVVYGYGLKEGEESLPFVVQLAGDYAGRLLEEMDRNDEAIRLYQRMAERIPSLKESADKRVAELAALRRATKN